MDAPRRRRSSRSLTGVARAFPGVRQKIGNSGLTSNIARALLYRSGGHAGVPLSVINITLNARFILHFDLSSRALNLQIKCFSAHRHALCFTWTARGLYVPSTRPTWPTRWCALYGSLCSTSPHSSFPQFSC